MWNNFNNEHESTRRRWKKRLNQPTSYIYNVDWYLSTAFFFYFSFLTHWGRSHECISYFHSNQCFCFVLNKIFFYFMTLFSLSLSSLWSLTASLSVYAIIPVFRSQLWNSVRLRYFSIATEFIESNMKDRRRDTHFESISSSIHPICICISLSMVFNLNILL